MQKIADAVTQIGQAAVSEAETDGEGWWKGCAFCIPLLKEPTR